MGGLLQSIAHGCCAWFNVLLVHNVLHIPHAPIHKHTTPAAARGHVLSIGWVQPMCKLHKSLLKIPTQASQPLSNMQATHSIAAGNNATGSAHTASSCALNLSMHLLPGPQGRNPSAPPSLHFHTPPTPLPPPKHATLPAASILPPPP